MRIDQRRIRAWAYENAYTLILMAVLFGITWFVMICYALWESTRGI